MQNEHIYVRFRMHMAMPITPSVVVVAAIVAAAGELFLC